VKAQPSLLSPRPWQAGMTQDERSIRTSSVADEITFHFHIRRRRTSTCPTAHCGSARCRLVKRARLRRARDDLEVAS
jgi:hypothetical protein